VAEKDFATVAIELAAIEHLDVPAMELLYRLECSGEDFYNLLADRIDDERAADLFRRNGREELGHARRIQRAISLKLGRDYEPGAAALTRFEIRLPDSIGPELLPAIVQGRSRATPATRSGPTTSPTPRSPGSCASTAGRRPATASESPRRSRSCRARSRWARPAASGGRAGRRSPDLPLFRRTLCQLSYPTASYDWRSRCAVPTGFEPAASALTGRRALQTALRDQNLHHPREAARHVTPPRRERTKRVVPPAITL
jgi:hypothetical protein